MFPALFVDCSDISFFQDFLLSEEGQQSLVDLHVDGIISYLGV